MDPDATLERIRNLIKDARAAADPATALANYAELADAVGNLDAWLCSGGFLPAAWTTKNRR